MLQGNRFERLWARVATLAAGVSLGAMTVWWLSPKNGRPGGSEGCPELDVLQGRLGDVPGGARVCLRDLGRGIVEAFGEAPDDEAVSRVLAVLREEPGIDFVVNRIWTPASAHARSADLTHSPRKRAEPTS